uniref:Uncharacterized protein n=1 Tax=Cacopsylla melanoneura TaxID=428564 RepID=A0A8D9FDU8_9HEMI
MGCGYSKYKLATSKVGGRTFGGPKTSQFSTFFQFFACCSKRVHRTENITQIKIKGSRYINVESDLAIGSQRFFVFVLEKGRKLRGFWAPKSSPPNFRGRKLILGIPTPHQRIL